MLVLAVVVLALVVLVLVGVGWVPARAREREQGRLVWAAEQGTGRGTGTCQPRGAAPQLRLRACAGVWRAVRAAESPAPARWQTTRHEVKAGCVWPTLRCIFQIAPSDTKMPLPRKSVSGKRIAAPFS